MIKTFIFGLVLGIVGAAVAVAYVPVVDQHRESSIIAVTTNGGNSETFHINIPMDRVMVGSPARRQPLPAGLQWPADDSLSGLRSELFKVRNERDTVIGVASRMASKDDAAGEVLEWVLHFPARGSIYISMQSNAGEGGYRVGRIRTGSGEFESYQGSMTERWVADTSGSEDAPAGRIELVSRFVGTGEEL